MKWKKGQSGNPNGRPLKGKTMTDLLRRLLVAKNDKGVTRRDCIISKLLEMAEAGQLEAIKYICDRLEGRPAQALELTGDEARPVTFRYIDGNEEA